MRELKQPRMVQLETFCRDTRYADLRSDVDYMLQRVNSWHGQIQDSDSWD